MMRNSGRAHSVRVVHAVSAHGSSRASQFALALLFISALGLAACGESSEEKAAKQVCAATSEITSQINKLKALPISSNFPSEAKASFSTMGKAVGDIQDAAPKLETARKEEFEAATKAFGVELARIAGSVASAATSADLQAALKSAEPQITAALNTLSSDYKKAFEALNCS
jgi:hypothetical protein